ncbi:MAG: CPBP family intramembrane metalloprotease [Clostridiaceae bacterium]|jgi:membrane protease YdiL (CAAX protease family)|nr:CPBP family intramembrane metalloprotease [Clostridiaceae bacterium]
MLRRKAVSPPPVRVPTGITGLSDPAKPAYPGLAGTLLLLHTLLNLAFFILRRSWPPLAAWLGGSSLKVYVFSVLLMQGVLILLPAVLVLLVRRPPPSELVGDRARPGSLFLAFAAGIPAAVVFHGLNNLLLYGLARSGVDLSRHGSASPLSLPDLLAQPWQLIVLILLLSTALPALVEELFFRGIILSSLQSGGAVLSAVLWQALAFALFHEDVFFLLPPFLAGLLLAHIRRRCGRLWPAMVTHFSLNLSLFALPSLLPDLSQSLLSGQTRQTSSLLYASLIAACIAAAALVPILILTFGLKPETPQPTKRLTFFPGDWKFALAILLQIVTMMLIQRA